jgi:MFS family permease
MIPIIYLVIQGVDAVVAPISGYAFDRYGLTVLAVPFLLSILPPLFLSSGAQLNDLLVASLFFGLVLGMQESTYRAAVSKFAPTESRGRAYGIFNTAYGIAFLVAGFTYGTFIDSDAPFMVILGFVVVMQALALAVLSQVYDKHADQKREDAAAAHPSDSSID